MIAVSMDDLDTQKRFKTELKAPFSFVSDPKGEVVNLYDVKTPVLSFAQRFTFVIGPDQKIQKVESGGDAIDPNGAISSCELKRKNPKPAGKPDAKPDAGH